MFKFSKKLLGVILLSVLLLSMVTAAAHAVSTPKSIDKKDTGISIESKEKKISSYKIIWNANGGKIGAKKTVATSVKKGNKIGKLVATPKRSGYSFKAGLPRKLVERKSVRTPNPPRVLVILHIGKRNQDL